MPEMSDRPPLPDGPALVVGLARSGVAAALVLRARGVAVAGCDSGPVAEASRERLEAAGVAGHAPSGGPEAPERAAGLGQSPRGPPPAPGGAAGPPPRQPPLREN